MTDGRQALEMVVALALAVLITVVLTPIFPRIASTAGGVIAATYFFSRYPWGGRETVNREFDAFLDDHLPF